MIMKTNKINTNSAGLIGIDVGTTAIKGVLVTGKGNIITSDVHDYSLEFGTYETCELDPEVYWNITCKIVHELIIKSGIEPENVGGISFSSQGETIISVDAFGKPLRKAIIWLDNRSVSEAKRIVEEFGIEKILEVTGQPEVIAAWPATRILWLRENEPDIFLKTSKFLMVEDYLLFRMTGKYCCEHSLVSSTLYFDIAKKTWWKEMLAFLQISEEKLPELFESGKSVGNLTAESAFQTGLTIKTICVTGAYDHPSGAVGAGNIEPGKVSLTIGTSMAMCVTLDKPVFDMAMKLPCQCHVIPGLYFLLPFAPAAGLVMKWFKEEFCKVETNMALEQNIDPFSILTEKALHISPGSDGLVVLPHYSGTGSPEFNSKVKGVFAGVTTGMNKGHFVRAILEGVVCCVEHNIMQMRQKGICIDEIRSIGGGAKSDLWNQILADMTGMPVLTMEQSENAATGAAILAGVGTGVFSSITDGCLKTIRVSLRFEPDPEKFELYRKVYNKYVSLYKHLDTFWG